MIKALGPALKLSSNNRLDWLFSYVITLINSLHDLLMGTWIRDSWMWSINGNNNTAKL